MRIGFVFARPDTIASELLAAHRRHLAFDYVPYYGKGVDVLRGDAPVLSTAQRRRARWRETVAPSNAKRRFIRLLAREFQRQDLDVVIANSGKIGARIHDACRIARRPMIVFFRGSDATSRDAVAKYSDAYRQLFEYSTAMIAVSSSIAGQLTAIGAPAERIHVIPSGIDPDVFADADPARAGPIFLAVGRFIEKKAPDLTVRAFHPVAEAVPDARLVMVGDGPLFGQVQRLAADLGLEGRVELTGQLAHEQVAVLMRSSRCFVQHSVVSANGNSEGAPRTVSEAQMSGLPVVATRHAGIPEIVVDGETAILVPERDVAAMSSAMQRIADDAQLAGRMGSAARVWASEHLSIGSTLDRFARIAEDAARAART